MTLKVLAGTALGCALVKVIQTDEKVGKVELLVTTVCGLVGLGALSTIGDDKSRERIGNILKKFTKQRP